MMLELSVFVKKSELMYFKRVINFFRPFERTAGENDKIYSIVHRFAKLCCQVEPLVLKELCVVAQLEVWKEDNITRMSHSYHQ